MIVLSPLSIVVVAQVDTDLGRSPILDLTYYHLCLYCVVEVAVDSAGPATLLLSVVVSGGGVPSVIADLDPTPKFFFIQLSLL